MAKDYRKWQKEKTRINLRNPPFFYEREVWWCTLGKNVGHEQDGGDIFFTRPVVILTKFNLNLCLVVPLTKKRREGRYYFFIGPIQNRNAVAILSQIRIIDSRRLSFKITTLPTKDYEGLVLKVVRICFPQVGL